MKRYPAPPIDPMIIERARELKEAGASQEEVFMAMRQDGLWVGQSIKVAAEIYGWSLTEAKMTVHYSDTWADCLQTNAKLHDAAFAAAKELGFEEVGSGVNGEKVALQEAS
ncbi:hypothetical protein [Granulicella tundricola]|uniref:Uncharacterized protein n=1 Tax=Granulicella tundricola (strain ATCC BAA-1859 / DSM 23138 / MP5ACTX9) TaxID=1198114 RepID=E8WXE7_GRATM|nr:hypothetical protein [Granulicella tundricola]ADW67480.1 hypothetical protein AciX9_0408 [Granulicella tundricola MP5ACTX9]